MNRKRYKQLRVVAAFFIGMIVSIAVVRDWYLLAVAAVITGMAFLSLVRSRVKIRTDERERTIQEKAGRMTYMIVAPTMGIMALLLLLPSKGGLAVFSRGEWAFIESIGMIFAYISLFLITVYAISYYIFNTKYGGGGDEE